ncbi:MAG: DUF5685 family protein [Oscillospiraceae bacterium]|nr:DUF5685 family protein [Oscillospiraceae bacterium]
MFGYIRANKPEMKVKEYEAYRGIYCSVCKALGRYFGPLSRLTLSYDAAFLALMRLSFAAKTPVYCAGHCSFNPAKKCNDCTNAEEELKYSAAVSMMMFYYKVRDNIADGSFWKRLAMYLILPYAFLKFKKAKAMYGEVCAIIAQAMENQRKNENSRTASADMAAHESASALGKIMAYGLPDGDGKIYRFGYGIGKFVYLADALDDMDKDRKTGSYNVFLCKYSRAGKDALTDEEKEEIRGTMNMSCAMAGEAYDNIENKSLEPIVENIIFDGMYVTMNQLLKGKNKNERSL